MQFRSVGNCILEYCFGDAISSTAPLWPFAAGLGAPGFVYSSVSEATAGIALARGGLIKGGTAYGATDDFGYRAAVNPVHPHDVSATLLHLLGLDQTRLTYRYSGRDFRLTDMHGKVIRDILA